MTITANDEECTSEPEASDEPQRARMAPALRDFEAAELRVERDAPRVNTETRSKLVAELLPVLDGLDRTSRAAQNARTASRWCKAFASHAPSSRADASSIHIATSGSKVALIDEVSSWSLAEDATRSAWTSPGVTELIDLLTVSNES